MRSTRSGVAGGGRVGHPAPDLLEREPRVLLGEEPRDLARLAPRHRLLEGEDAAHAPPGLGRQDDDRPVPLDGDEVDALEARVLERRRQDHRGVVGELRELRRRRLHEVVDLAAGARDLALEAMRVRATDLRAAHQAVDVVPVGLVGRHPARRGVGLGQIAHLLQVGHGVADRGRGEAERVLLGQLAGPDGFRRDRVFEQQGLEHLPLALVQLVASHGLPVRCVSGWTAGTVLRQLTMANIQARRGVVKVARTQRDRHAGVRGAASPAP